MCKQFYRSMNERDRWLLVLSMSVDLHFVCLFIFQMNRRGRRARVCVRVIKFDKIHFKMALLQSMHALMVSKMPVNDCVASSVRLSILWFGHIILRFNGGGSILEIGVQTDFQLDHWMMMGDDSPAMWLLCISQEYVEYCFWWHWCL